MFVYFWKFADHLSPSRARQEDYNIEFFLQALQIQFLLMAFSCPSACPCIEAIQNRASLRMKMPPPQVAGRAAPTQAYIGPRNHPNVVVIYWLDWQLNICIYSSPMFNCLTLWELRLFVEEWRMRRHWPGPITFNCDISFKRCQLIVDQKYCNELLELMHQ